MIKRFVSLCNRNMINTLFDSLLVKNESLTNGQLKFITLFCMQPGIKVEDTYIRDRYILLSTLI